MDVVVVKSKRKTLVLTVNSKGKLEVRAPYGTSEEAIGSFLERHRVWIARRIAEREDRKFDLTDGSKVSLCGKDMTIATGKAKITENMLFLPMEGREEVFVGILKRLTRVRMTELTEQIATQYGFHYSCVRVTSARSRWGSCSKNGNISYTFRSAFLPNELAEYLAVHELCHTRHFNHGAAFWREVGRILPDFATRRKTLRVYEWAMNELNN